MAASCLGYGFLQCRFSSIDQQPTRTVFAGPVFAGPVLLLGRFSRGRFFYWAAGVLRCPKAACSDPTYRSAVRLPWRIVADLLLGRRGLVDGARIDENATSPGPPYETIIFARFARRRRTHEDLSTTMARASTLCQFLATLLIMPYCAAAVGDDGVPLLEIARRVRDKGLQEHTLEHYCRRTWLRNDPHAFGPVVLAFPQAYGCGITTLDIAEATPTRGYHWEEGLELKLPRSQLTPGPKPCSGAGSGQAALSAAQPGVVHPVVHPLVPNKIRDRFAPCSSRQGVFDGYLDQRMQNNILTLVSFAEAGQMGGDDDVLLDRDVPIRDTARIESRRRHAHTDRSTRQPGQSEDVR